MTHEHDWTTHELELYRDDALEPGMTDDLSTALRESPALRERLARVAHRDAMTRAALLREAPEPRRIRWLVPALAGAAALALLVTAFLMWPAPPPPSIAGTHPSPPSKHDATRPNDSMIVFSIAVRPKPLPTPEPVEQEKPAPPTTAQAAPAKPPAPPAPEFVSRLDAALARGDAAEAAALLSTASDDQRQAGYQRLAAVLRSVTTARRVLAELPAEEQLAACRQLVLEPRWRTVTCAQLVTLRTDPDLRPNVEEFLAELSRLPELAPFAQRVRTSPAPPREPTPRASDRSI